MRARIRHGEWAKGEQIPTETELCRLYGASRITIRQAVRELATEGLLSPLRGKGTFVREPAITAGDGGLNSFSQAMSGLGMKSSARLLDQALIPATPDVAHKLDLSTGDPVVRIRRVRMGDGNPIGIQDAHLVAVRFPGLETACLGSLYAHLWEQYGVRPELWDETFRVGPVRAQDARLLDCPTGFCCFFGERRTYDQIGVFELTSSIMRGDRYQVHLSMTSETGDRASRLLRFQMSSPDGSDGASK